MMNLHSATYRNHMNETIQLTIRQYRSSSSKCKITIKRVSLGIRWFLLRLLVYFTISQIALMLLLSFNRIQIRFLWSVFLFLFIALILYTFSPVKEESIILFDNLNGIEYEKHFLFGKCTSTFINTNRIIINEAITMQRVIFYMVAIPICLQPFVLNEEPEEGGESYEGRSTTIPTKRNNHLHHPDHHSTDEAFKQALISDSRLIPLFMSTLPRLDCLKVIYSQVTKYRQSTSKSSKNVTTRKDNIMTKSSTFSTVQTNATIKCPQDNTEDDSKS